MTSPEAVLVSLLSAADVCNEKANKMIAVVVAKFFIKNLY
jgi:hypothetical protein